jgi:hypothetical protein
MCHVVSLATHSNRLPSEASNSTSWRLTPAICFGGKATTYLIQSITNSQLVRQKPHPPRESLVSSTLTTSTSTTPNNHELTLQRDDKNSRHRSPRRRHRCSHKLLPLRKTSVLRLHQPLLHVLHYTNFLHLPRPSQRQYRLRLRRNIRHSRLNAPQPRRTNAPSHRTTNDDRGRKLPASSECDGSCSS